MSNILKQKLVNKLQPMFWIYITNNFIIRNYNDIKLSKPKILCNFIPITIDNCHRIMDFREKNRIFEYMDKLLNKEIGYFAEYDGKIIGSVWATINKTNSYCVFKGYFRLMPNDSIMHDIVINPQWRAIGIGTFMAGQLAYKLLKEYGVSRIIIDINIRNKASLSILRKLGVEIDHTMLSISVLGKLLTQIILKKYND